MPTTVQSWEVYYAGTGEGSMPVQCALFRLSGAAAPSVAGGGYLFDDYLGRLETQ